MIASSLFLISSKAVLMLASSVDLIEFLTKLITEIVAKYNIDGVNIDYVRYPNIAKENYGNQWGYTPYAREEFMRLYDMDPLDIEPKSP